MTTITAYALCTCISNSITNIPLYATHFHVMYEADRADAYNRNIHMHEHVQYMEYLVELDNIVH